MGAAGNVEEETTRRIKRDQRRIAVTPIGDLFEERVIGILIFLRDAKVGDRAASIGKARAQAESTPLGNMIDGDDAERVFDLRYDRERQSLRKRA